MRENMIQKLTFLVIFIALVSNSLQAEVSMGKIFDNGMVLQRDLPVSIWGKADPGEKVLVSFAGQEVNTVADEKGAWLLKLSPLATSNKGQTLTIQGNNKLTFEDILVGEVWLCSGQSNMAGRFGKTTKMDPAVFQRDLTKFRFSSPRGWHTLSTETQNLISRVSFHFGIELYKKLNIPIGLIMRYNSGTPIQSWMPKDASETIRKKLNIAAHWNDDNSNRAASFQFEDKIRPILPATFRGVIWYQGERNAKSELGYEYDELLAFHIATWRQLWAEQSNTSLRKFPFYYVQVPTQESPVEAEWPWLRDRMRRALDKTENTGMAIFYDYGPSLHPENKKPAGERLSLWALAKDYGQSDLVHCGPLLDTANFSKGQATLTFKHTGSGLQNKNGGTELKFFEIAGQDGRYVAAKAQIIGKTVVVKSSEVTNPIYVRYLFRKAQANPEVSLINAEGLPASSFITDNIKPERIGFTPKVKARSKK
jgi:sialate O-acetylesterase